MDSVQSYCRIRNGVIQKDGKIILDLSDRSLDDFFLKAYETLQVNYPKFYKMDRLGKLGLLGSEIILSDKRSSLDPQKTSVILSNSNSSLDTDLKYWESTKTVASPSLFVYTLPNIVAGEICIRNGFKGESNFFVTPAFDAAWIVQYVNLVMARNNMSTCLAGWVDVLNDQAEVFLYLTEKSATGICGHTADNIRDLYNGRISSKS